MSVLVGLLPITNSYVESSLDACFVPNRIADNSIRMDQICNAKLIRGNRVRRVVQTNIGSGGGSGGEKLEDLPLEELTRLGTGLMINSASAG
jgi:hypothetical protein